MHYDKPFELDDEPRVPKTIRWNLMRILRGARHIVVAAVEDGATKKINGIKLKTKATPHALPDENPDEIAEGICRIMHHAWVEKNLNAQPDEFIALHCRISAKVDHPQRGGAKTPSFDWSYDPDGATSEMDEIGELEKTTMMQLLEASERSRETDRMHIEQMQDKFLELAGHLGTPLAAVGDILQYSGGLSLQGSQMMVSALQTTFSMEMMDRIEAHKTRRSEMMWGRVGGWLDMGVQGLIDNINQVLSKKFGKGKQAQPPRTPPNAQRPSTNSDDDEEEWRPPQPAGGPRPDPDAAAREAEAQAAAAEDEAKAESDPIASLCQSFGDMMTAKQQRALDDLMTKREKQIFYRLVCAEEDAEAVDAWRQLEDMLPMTKLVQLNALLSREQQQIFLAVRKLVSDWQIERSASEAEDEESEGDSEEEDDDPPPQPKRRGGGRRKPKGDA